MLECRFEMLFNSNLQQSELETLVMGQHKESLCCSIKEVCKMDRFFLQSTQDNIYLCSIQCNVKILSND